jgi:hypothetical protein
MPGRAFAAVHQFAARGSRRSVPERPTTGAALTLAVGQGTLGQRRWFVGRSPCRALARSLNKQKN